MKISQLDTARAIDILCELTPYITSITGDKTLMDTLSEKIGSGKSQAEIMLYGAKKISALVPIVLKEHKNDVFGILSILNETTAEEIEKQNIMVTMQQIKEICNDKELLDFFKQRQQEAETE